MQRRELLLSYAPLADFIARMNGDGCEALIHDVRDPLHSVIYITQPTLTGRSLGDGMTDYAVELVESRRYLTDPFVVNYVGGSPEQIFRSSTYFIRDGKELAGLLCVNIDISSILEARKTLDQVLILDPALLGQGSRKTFLLGSSAVEKINAVCAQFAGAHAPERCPTEVKRRIARQLQEYGVFELKGQVSEVAKRLGVSEKTIYRYLKEV